MSKNRMAPPVRFQGFTEPWEQRKLGEIADRITRKNTNLEATRPLTEYSATGVPPIRKSGTAFPRKVYRLSAKVYRLFFRL